MGKGKQQSLLPLSVVGNARSESQGMAPELAPYTNRGRELPVLNSHNHLWISIYFKYLSIESISISNLKPEAILEEQKHQARILVCNQAAEQLGIRSGLSVKAALALVPELTITRRDIRLETRVLQRLATWATRFTPAVSVDSSNVLLLDVHASLKFFGGLPKLWELLIGDLDRWGYRATFACAPTALASIWLARASDQGEREVPQYSRHRLAALSVACLRWPENIQKMLREIGVGTLGECVRLPRDGLARRIGPEKLCELDQGFGLQPESREFYRPARRFHAELELPAETSDSQRLLESLGRLLASLKIFMRENQSAVQVLWIRFHYYDKPPQLLRIGLLQAVIDTDYLLDLARIRFADNYFSAPVVSIALQADPVTIHTATKQDLFDCNAAHGAGVVELLEQLQVRLGSQAVHGIRPAPEHRPESAWNVVRPCDEDSKAIIKKTRPGKSTYDRAACRPLWMLTEPRALPMVAGRPVFQGELSLEDNPERIETGWWDGQDVRRDYYRAWNHRGMRLWVFKDCRESCWYLHGLFG